MSDIVIRDGDLCTNCGTDLVWWLRNDKRHKVYVTPAEELFCKQSCFWGYYKPSLAELKTTKEVASE